MMISTDNMISISEATFLDTALPFGGTSLQFRIRRLVSLLIHF